MKEITKLNRLINITKHTNDFFSFCDIEGLDLTNDWVSNRLDLDIWQRDEDIEQEIVDKVWNYLVKNIKFKLDLSNLYYYYKDYDYNEPIPDEAEFRKFWKLNKRQYDRAMKYFADTDFEYKKAEIDIRMKKMNSDF